MPAKGSQKPLKIRFTATREEYEAGRARRAEELAALKPGQAEGPSPWSILILEALGRKAHVYMGTARRRRPRPTRHVRSMNRRKARAAELAGRTVTIDE